MLHFSGLFCFVSGRGETHFLVSAAQSAAKVSVGKYGSTIHGASDRADSQGVRCIGVDKQSNWRELEDSERLFLFGPKKRKFDPFGESFRASSGAAGPRRCPQQSWEPGKPTEFVGARDNRACLVALNSLARSRCDPSYFGFNESLPSHRRDARTSICGLAEQRFRARLQVPLVERTDTRRRRPSSVCPPAAGSEEEFLPPRGGRCPLHRMAHAICACDHRQT
jgi:hypothetical protein